MPKRAGDGKAMTVDEVLTVLKRSGSRRTIDGMARYGLAAAHPIGVTVATLNEIQKRIGTDHALSLALWESGWYEARLLAAMIGDPARVTRRQMNSWARSFENWGDCDTACFKLFDRSPLAWEMAIRWSSAEREFVRRGGFALMACLALHDRDAGDDRFLNFLPHIESGADDPRNFVKKAVSWALRGIGARNKALNAAGIAVARRLAASDDPAPRWVGKDALRDLTRPSLKARLARKSAPRRNRSP